MKTETIDKYLLGEMTAEEQSAFEQDLQQDAALQEDVRIVAYIIHSLKQVGIEEENQRLQRLRAKAPTDRKRYVASVAAILIAGIMVAATISVPIYNKVVKPLIENTSKEMSQTPSLHKPLVSDSLLISNADSDSLDMAGSSEEGSIASTNETEISAKHDQAQIKETDVKKDAESMKAAEQGQPKEPAVKSEEKHEETKNESKATQASAPATKRTNKVESQLKDYVFSKVTAQRHGNSVVCTFTMQNEYEDAEIQMHSARAKDNNGKNYPAKDCTLNGKTKRIVEKWKKGEVHTITIAVQGVDASVKDFDNISFSFQSKGNEKKQNSLPIVLKIGIVE